VISVQAIRSSKGLRKPRESQGPEITQLKFSVGLSNEVIFATCSQTPGITTMPTNCSA
jgi:hypothetical protein